MDLVFFPPIFQSNSGHQTSTNPEKTHQIPNILGEIQPDSSEKPLTTYRSPNIPKR